MTLDRIWELLGKTAFTLDEQAISFGKLLALPLVLILGYILGRWFISVMSKRMVARNTAPDLVHLFQRITYVLVLVLLFITALDFINVPITAFAFVSGAVAIGVGFGAQNIINNFISGWILMWERPIRIGDFLEVEGAKGRVETINTRSTRIRRTDGVHMLIPNSTLLENTVVNWTLMDRLTRTSVIVGVAYGSPVKRVAELMVQAAREQDATLAEPPPAAYFDDFGDNALIFEVVLWIHATVERDLREIRSNIRFRIDDLFRNEDIVIAYPQRDIHVDGAVRIIQDKGGVNDQP